MSFSFGELSRMEQSLVDLGEQAASQDPQALLEHARDWFEQARAHGDFGVDPETFGVLCSVVRRPISSRTRSIAVGSLLRAEREQESDLRRSAFVIRFALKRIRAHEEHASLWTESFLTTEEEEEALEIFQEALEDTSYGEEELSLAAEAFIRNHQFEIGIFGRLAGNLRSLLNTLKDPAATEEHRRVARAALCYFALADDAVDDELGLVGLLDDAWIAQRAVAEVHPERQAVVRFLDSVIERWPFLQDVRFVHDGVRCGLSEFLLVNAASLIEDLTTEDRPARIALVVPDTGPLPFLLGFLAALGRAVGNCRTTERPTYEDGDRLRNRGTKAEVVFRGYARSNPNPYLHVPVECGADEAEFFRYECCVPKNQGGTGKPGEIRFSKIEALSAFVRSNRASGNLRSSNLVLNADGLEPGPLERLLGLSEATDLSGDTGTLVAVGPVGEVQELAANIEMCGHPLTDAFPISYSQRLGPSKFEDHLWSAKAIGSRPYLTIARTSGDAWALAQDQDRDVRAVIAPVRPGSQDSTHLARLAAEGTPVVALVETRDAEAQDHLAKEGFRLWTWDSWSSRILHWPTFQPETRHPILRYERRVQGRTQGNEHVVELDLPPLTQANQALQDLRAKLREDQDESLDDCLEAAFHLIWTLCGILTPLGTDRSSDLQGRLDDLEAQLHRGSRYLPQELADIAEGLVPLLRKAVELLETENPKYRALQGWISSNPEGHLLSRRQEIPFLSGNSVLPSEQLLSRVPPSGVPSSLLIGGWFARERMTRLLFPPVAPHTTVLLYGPEARWYQAFARRRQFCTDRLQRRSERHSPFQGLQRSARPPRPVAPPTPTQADDPEDILARAQRRELNELSMTTSGEFQEARIVHFQGGSWTAFSPSGKVHTATHMIGAASDVAMNSDLPSIEARDLEPGDLVLMLRGSSHDAIRSIADKEGRVGLRRDASRWREALRRFRREGRSIEYITRRLAAEGCERMPTTVGNWIDNDDIIGPQYPARDIEAILAVTEDEDLATHHRLCISAIFELRKLHKSVSHRLAGQVLERATEWISAGATPDELIVLEDRVVLVTVRAVEQALTRVPRKILNRLQESRWLE